MTFRWSDSMTSCSHRLTQPPLTTIVLSRTQLAITALAALDKLIRKDPAPPIEYTIPTHLVLRRSTRAI